MTLSNLALVRMFSDAGLSLMRLAYRLNMHDENKLIYSSYD